MVTIKGHKISNKLARDSIKAMEKLIYLYKNRFEFLGCPLCIMIEDTGADDCDDCPWVIFTKEECWNDGNYFEDIVHNNERRKKRIRQLYYWISVYRNKY